jgi:cell fate regulator YaaT (PSP1 superfamily)
LPIYLNEFSPSNEWKVFWKCFELEVIGVNEDGRPKKRVEKCFKETSSSTFLEYLNPNIQKFVKHNFVAT